MTSDNQGQYVVSIFAVTDNDGEAQHINCSIDTPGQSRAAFSRFLNKVLSIGDMGSYLPDLRIRHYTFGEDVSLQDIKLQVDTPGALQSFVQRNGGKLVHDYPLRSAVYIRWQSERILKHVTLKELDELSNPQSGDPTIQNAKRFFDELEKFESNLGIPNRFVVVYETGRGTVAFDDSGYGQLCSRKFIQFLADHFFDPTFRDIQKIRESVVVEPSPRIMAQVDACRKMFSKLDLRIVPERLTFYPSLLKNEHKQGSSARFAFGTDMSDFRRLIDVYKLKMSEENLYIIALMRVRDCGFAPGFITSSIRAQQFFAEELKKYNAGPHPDPLRVRLPSAESRKAEQELKERFGIGVKRNVPSLKKGENKSGPKL